MALKTSFDADDFAKGKVIALIVGQDGTDYGVVKVDPTTQNLEIMEHRAVAEVILTLDTNIYATGDVLAATQDVGEVFRKNGGAGVIQSVAVIDLDDQAQAIDLIFLDLEGAIGTENAAVSIADNVADNILGIVSVAAADYVDMVNSQVATAVNVGIAVKAQSSSKHLYVAAVCRSGTPTHSAAGIVLKVGIVLD